jgi:hypothetical protein
MTLVRLGIGWAAVAAWFFIFEQVERRIAGPSPAAGKLRADWRVYVADAVLLTLFSALWFASLGHGGWVLLFLMTGLLVEGPARYRDGAARMDLSGRGMVRLGLGVARIVVAGGLLSWLL